MIDVHDRPDLRKLLTEIEMQYGSVTIVKNAVMIPIPEWQRERDWYGIGLVFDNSNRAISVYLCYDDLKYGPMAHIDTLWTTDASINEIIDFAKRQILTCPYCHKHVDSIHDIEHTTTYYQCKECYAKHTSS